MTPDQKAAIRSTFALAAPAADTVAIHFYERLFAADPTLRPLFAHTDMAGQRKALMQTLAVVVGSLDKLDTIVPAVQALGRRHAGYGVTDDDYATVGAALLGTFEDLLGDAFTAEAREAWAAAYGLLSGIMCEAAADLSEVAA
jgi:nitric oxide dioxygenase